MKVYLKFNKTDTVGYMCLLSWLEIFRNYETVIVCDLFDVTKDQLPKFLSEIISRENKHIPIINTDYKSCVFFNDLIDDPRYRNAAAANATCLNHNQSNEPFWLIDADDTMILTRDFEFIQQKFVEAEQCFVLNNLDCLSLDFYRMQNNTWSFGICIVNSRLDLQYARNNLSNADYEPKDTKCLDICFDKLRRKNLFNLKTFIVNNLSFIHYVHRSRNLPYCLYHWENNKLNGKTVPGDFIKL